MNQQLIISLGTIGATIITVIVMRVYWHIKDKQEENKEKAAK